jgi:phosphopentomutase
MKRGELLLLRRCIIIVLDSLGIGELPDAGRYGDNGSDTLGNIYRHVPGFRLPNLEKLGLGNIAGISGPGPVDRPWGCFGKMAELSPGKDTTTGHWEIAGIILDKPFPTYPNGFPREIIDEFEKAIGRKVLGNITASGTEIIEKLGYEHERTGFPIVYTSADSVFQIAAHESIIPVYELYEMCARARTILTGEHAVARVIARPFAGQRSNYIRTSRRHDFSLDPPGQTVLDIAEMHGLSVKAVGKIKDIFNGRGITEFVHTSNNKEGMDNTIAYIKQGFEGIIFTNLVDFDMLYGHRNNVLGYAEALSEFDERVPELLNSLMEEDLLFITADHGCDPTTSSTDHSREYVPLLVYGNAAGSGVNLGIRKTFSDVSATIADYLGIGKMKNGTSFYHELINGGC